MKSTCCFIVLTCLLGLAIAQGSNNLYTSAENKKYFIEARHKFNWYESWMECKSKNMDFLAIDSPEKSDEIKKLINDNFKEKDKPLLYIGGNDMGQAKHFAWISKGKEFEYTNWNAYEPNNYKNGEHCVHIGLYDDGTWNDVDCEMKFGYICE